MLKMLALGLTAAIAFPAAAAAGGVKGRINYKGKTGSAKSIKMNTDPKCLAQHKDGFKYQKIVVDADGGLANAFIYVKEGLEGKKFTPPKESKAILDQKGCWYQPRVSGIMVGQTMTILNSDPTMHNVNAMPNFNAAMPAGVVKMKKKFKKSKVMFKIKCNVHPWMRAYVGILDHPYYAVSGADGGYEIADLPPGKYTLSVWHEKMKRQSIEITVGKDGAKADFELKKKGRKRRKKRT